MKRIIPIATLLTLCTLAASAQEKKSVVSTPQFNGYFLGNYQATFDQNGEDSNGFSLRMLRMTMKGKILDEFEYIVQGQANGNTSTLGASPRIVDLNIEWQRHKEFRVKVGQFKRPFTFENPGHPIDNGFSTLSQVVTNLSGFTDRTGEQASNGRDIGIQAQGDLLPNAKGRALLHYQVGLFNGQGINTGDVDNKKDLIGGVWVSPVKNVRLGVFGWEGTHARKGTWTDAADGATHNGVRSLRQHRYAFSSEYKDDDWLVRAEYIHSTGYGFKTRNNSVDDAKDCQLNGKGNKADGWYVQCIAPVIPGKLRVKGRYDYYRPSGSNDAIDDTRKQVDFGLNYLFHKNVELQTQYSIVKDNSLSDKNYSYINAQFCVRF